MKSSISIVLLLSVVGCHHPDAYNSPPSEASPPSVNLSGHWVGAVFDVYDVFPSDWQVSLQIVHNDSELAIWFEPDDTVMYASFEDSTLYFVIERSEMYMYFTGTLIGKNVYGVWATKLKTTGQDTAGSQWYIERISALLDGRAQLPLVHSRMTTRRISIPE